VCALLSWILSRVTRPIRDMTEAMDRLSAGEFGASIPALDRRDEIGAMARFKENSIERDRLEFLTQRLQQTTEELRRESAMVSHLAQHDTMTGLVNRATFKERLNLALRQRAGTALRSPSSVSTSTISRTSTTRSVMRKATCCCRP
jgi:methyl-accepting chemotaxis protein